MSNVSRRRQRDWGTPRTNDPVGRMVKGTIALTMEKAFFGHIVQRMPRYPLDEPTITDTACVDAKGNMYYHKAFIASLDLEHVKFVMAHEVMHIVQRAQARMPIGCNHRLWNLACDQVLNTMLIDNGFELPPFLLTGLPGCKPVQPPEVSAHIRGDDPGGEHGKSTYMTCEQRYYELLEEMKNAPDECEACKQGVPFPKPGQDHGQGGSDGGSEPSQPGEGHSHGDGEPCDHEGAGQPGDGIGGGGRPEHTCENWCEGACATDIANADPQDLHEWEQRILGAAEIARGRGTLPGFMNEYLAELTKPTVRWTDHVRVMAQSIFRGRYVYARPNRRESSLGFRMPRRKPVPKCAVIMMDTSGSISDQYLNQSATEVLGILQQTGCTEVWVFFHDTNCYHYELMKPSTVTKLKVTRAGTSHVDVFAKVDEVFKNNLPGMVIAFTDLDTAFPDKTPSYQVVWAHPEGDGEDKHVPWGKKVAVRLA